MLDNLQIDELISKMGLNEFYKGCYFKDELKTIEPIKSFYVLNLHSMYNEKGKLNTGSHWVCLVVKDKNAMYFDSYGTGPPKEIKKLCKKSNIKLSNTTKNIQSMMSDLCGFFCLAFSYFIFKYKKRTKDLITDTSIFIDLFEDLDKVDDIYKNEFILSLFFTNKDTKETLLNNNNVINEDNQLNQNYDIENAPLRT